MTQGAGWWYDEGRQYARSLAALERMGDQRGLAGRGMGRVRLALLHGDCVEAERWGRQSLALAEGIADAGTTAWAMLHLCDVARARGDVADAEEWGGRSLAGQERVGDQSGFAHARRLLGQCALRAGGAHGRLLGVQDGGP